MSGSTIGGVVGGIVGSFFGPMGTQIGFMLGSAIGGYIDPEVIKTQGPKWSDAPQQTARDGVPIPWGYGTFPTTGNLIWNAPIVETPVTTRTQEGKGGGGPVNEHESFQYTISYAVGICEGPIAGILIAKRYGKIVYDQRTDAELTAVGYDAAAIQQTRAASAVFMQNAVIYLGTEDQVPDSVMEAHLGVGNVSAHRGLAYIRFENEDISDMKAIPQWEFVVVSEGTVESGFGAPQWIATNGDETGVSEDGTTWDQPVEDTSTDAPGTRLNTGGGVVVKWSGSTIHRSTDRGVTWQDPSVPPNLTGGTGTSPIKYFGGKWWSVRSSSVYTSTDADVWTETFAGPAGSNTCIGGHDQLAIIGDNFGSIVYSTNGGATWSGSQNILGGGTTDLCEITSNGELVVAVGEDNVIAVTANGSTWGIRTSPFPPGSQIERVRWSEGLELWVILSPGNGIAYSEDTVTWNLATTTFPDGVRGVDANDDLFVAVGGGASTPRVYTSTDGDIWTTRTNVFTVGLLDIAAMPCDGTPIPDAPGFYAHDDGTICGPAGDTIAREDVVVATIVADVCRREGLDASEYDVSDLTDMVEGARVAVESDGISIVAGQLVYSCADPAEFDGKLWFFKRGRASVATLTMDDLAERDGDAIEQTRVQEAELLRRATLGYVSALSTYTPTTQTFERRAATIQAKGEGSTDIPVVADDLVMAQLAEKRVKVAWSETEKYKFSLPQKFSYLTPTDVVTLIDANSVSHRIRIMQIEEDSGVLLVEGIRDHEAAYTGFTTAASVPTIPPPVPPTVRGPTVMVAFNGPPPNLDAGAKAGIWVAVRGLLTGWAGCNLFISYDGGETETFVDTLVNPARIGWLRSAITSSSTTIPVQFYGDAEVDTVSQAQLDALQNLWVIKTGENAEFGQSMTSTPNGDGFDLTDNDRGFLSTPVTSHFADDDFVMVDEACYYIPVDIRYDGFTLQLRAASRGTTAANNTITTLVYDPPEIVWDGNGPDEEEPDTPTPGGGGAGTPGTPTARTIGATVSTPSLTAGEANAAANSAAINAAFAGLPGGGGIVRLPAGTYYIDTSDPIEPVSNSRLDCTTNSTTLRAKGSNTTTAPSVHRDIVRVDGVTEVEIAVYHFIGYRDYWAANGGVSAFGVSEWAHGIYVTGSSNVTIYNGTLEKFVGDGISLGRTSHHIHVINMLSTLNRRQGISTGSDDVLIENCECSYIGLGDGTAPKAGIDIEVDLPDTNQATNVEISNCHLHHNAGPGLIAYRSCDNINAHDNIMEYNSKGVYAYDSNTADLHDNIIRYNKYEGVHLASTCVNWDLDGNTFYGNKTQQYGTPSAGLDTTTSPTTTQKAKHITVASTVTGTTYGTNTYGPV